MTNQILVKNQKMGNDVLARVKSLESQGDLKFPANYSPENAMKSDKLAMFENGKAVKEIVPGDATTTIVKDKNGDIKDVEVKVENK